VATTLVLYRDAAICGSGETEELKNHFNSALAILREYQAIVPVLDAEPCGVLLPERVLSLLQRCSGAYPANVFVPLASLRLRVSECFVRDVLARLIDDGKVDFDVRLMLVVV
jgi:hypothetical protein